MSIALPTTAFVLAAGAVEVLFGLVVAAGRARATTSFLVAGPFVATLPLFGWPELVGHGPIHVVLLVVAVAPVNAGT